MEHCVFIPRGSDEWTSENQIDKTLGRLTKALWILDVYKHVSHWEQIAHILTVGIPQLGLIALDEPFCLLAKCVGLAGVS